MIIIHCKHTLLRYLFYVYQLKIRINNTSRAEARTVILIA